MKRMLTRGSLLVAAATLAAGGIAMSPSGAVTHLQTCKTLKGSVAISPGISAVPHAQTAKATSNLTGCASATATGGSGTLNGTLKLPANSSCAGLAGGKQKLGLTATTKWKNGKTSTYALTATTGSGPTVLVATIAGKVSKGLFVGKKVTGQIKVALAKGQNCATVPVTKLNFTNTKPFVIG
jgi:hypothetical protein